MLAVTGVLEAEALYERSLLSYPLQTLLNFGTTSKATMRSASNPSRRRPEIPAELQGVPAANDFRRKIEFIRDVVREWVANEGIGNSDTSREGRLRWGGRPRHPERQDPRPARLGHHWRPRRRPPPLGPGGSAEAAGAGF